MSHRKLVPLLIYLVGFGFALVLVGDHFHWFGQVAHWFSRMSTPEAKIWPTVVAFQNPGGRDGRIQSVEFQILQRRPSPTRQRPSGDRPTIKVEFDGADISEDTRDMRYIFYSHPVPVAGDGKPAAIEIAVLAPDRVGTTYVGRLILHFEGGKSVDIDGVELDALPMEAR